MKMTLFFVSTIGICLTLLLGFNDSVANSLQSKKSIFGKDTTINNEIVKAEILDKNGNKLMSFTDQDSLNTFESAIKTARQADGVPKMRPFDFKMVIFFTNDDVKYYDLWLTSKSKQASLAEYDTLFTLTEEATIQLKNIIFTDQS